MQLNDTQKQAVRQWVAEGCSLTEIQKRLRDQFGVSATFLDVRFLVLDLGAALKDQAPPVSAAGLAVDKNGGGPAEAEAEPDDVLDEQDAAGVDAGGSVSVSLDRIVKPGAVVSGTVRFSDGVTAAWMLDQVGRLALEASKPKYRPSAGDIQAFQMKLRTLLQDQGF